MKTQPLTVLAFFAFAVWLYGGGALASPVPQNERSKSDADINAIGHRNITRDANFYSPVKEKELGKAQSQEVERSSKLLDDPIVTEYVGRIAQNVAKNSDARFPVTVRVIDSDVVNSFTLPGGYQYINRGLLLRLENEAELASVLARGIAHTALRSATRMATKSDILQIANSAASVFVVPGSDSHGVDFLVPLTVLKMRRQDELEADYFGAQYLYRAGYDPKCFVDFVQRIWGTSSATAKNDAKVFSTFPPLDERLAALQNEISSILPPRHEAIVSTAEFDAFKERLPAQESGPELTRPPEKAEPSNTQPTADPN